MVDGHDRLWDVEPNACEWGDGGEQFKDCDYNGCVAVHGFWLCADHALRFRRAYRRLYGEDSP